MTVKREGRIKFRIDFSEVGCELEGFGIHLRTIYWLILVLVILKFRILLS